VSVEGYVQMLKGLGSQVRCVDGVYWFEAQPRIFTPLPFNRLFDPDTVDVPGILGRDGLAVRFPCPIDRGRSSYRLVCADRSYGLNTLDSKARNQTRRGLERCRVAPIPLARLASEGAPLNRETLERQGRKTAAQTDRHWQRVCEAGESAEGVEAWGAWVDDQLAACLIAARMNGASNILYVRSASALLKAYPNNALLFTYLGHCMAEPDIAEVSIGFESIQADLDALDHFKTGLGFVKLPLGQKIVPRPWLGRLLRTPLASGLASLARVAGRERAAKLEGLRRWYLEQPRDQ
jgi:hypothetical protein